MLKNGFWKLINQLIIWELKNMSIGHFFISKVIIVHPKSCIERCLFQKWWFFIQNIFIHGRMFQTLFGAYKYLHKHSFQHIFTFYNYAVLLSFFGLWFMCVQEILEVQSWFSLQEKCLLVRVMIFNKNSYNSHWLY